MKKLCALLLLLGVMLAFPLNALAVVSFALPKEPNKKENASDDTMNYIYNLSVVTTESEVIDKEEGGITLGFKGEGAAVKSFTCKANDDFTVTQSEEDGLTYCTFVPKSEDGVSGEKIALGQLVALIDLNAEDDDCTIWYQLGDVNGKITVNTGSSVPYIVITGGIVLGAAVYFATKKKSKLQRI